MHNGTDPCVPVGAPKTSAPRMCVVGRLVPHKQVEHAIDAALRAARRAPGPAAHVVGSGWWEDELHAYAARARRRRPVVFEGHVDEERKHEIYDAVLGAGAAVAQGGLGPGRR